MTDGLWHVTLTTGDVRWSPRAEVADAILPTVAAHIARARRRGPAVVPGQADVTARARSHGHALAVTLRWHDDDEILRMWIAPTLARALELAAPCDWMPAAAMVPAPACLVRLADGLARYPAVAHWLGDYERCTAWAWLERSRRS